MAAAQETRYESFADVAALEKEQAKVLKIFSSIETGVKKLSGLGISIGASSKLPQLTGETLEFQEALKAVLKLQKDLVNQELKTQVVRQKEFKDLESAKIANKELSDSIKFRLKLRMSEEGSLEQMGLKLQKVTKLLSGLNETQRNSARGQELTRWAADLSNTLNDLSKKSGNFKNNIGRYAESLADGFENVRREIARLKQEQASLGPGASQGGPGEDSARYEKISRSIEQLDKIQQISLKNNQSFAQTVKQIGREYENMAASGEMSIEFLQEFKKFAADAKDQAADLKDEIKALSSDTRSFDLVSGSISAVASGFEVAAGAQALFGEAGEDVQKVTQRLVAVQSVANGVREIATQLTQRGTAANKLYAFVQAQVAIATNGAATATARLNAVMKLSVIGLIAFGLYKLATSLNVFGNSSKEAEKRTDDLTKSLERQKEAIAKIDAAYQNTGKIRRERLKQQGADERKLFDDELSDKKQQEEELKGIVKKAREDESKFEEDFNNRISKVKELFGRKNVTISKKNSEEIAKQRSINNDKIVNAEQALADKQAEIILFSEEFKTKQYEDTKSKQEEAAQRAVEDYKRNVQEEKAAALELYKFRQQLIIDQENINASDDSFLYVNQKVQAAQKAFDAQKAIVKAQQLYELGEQGITNSKRILINEKAAEDIRKGEEELQKKIFEIRFNAIQKEKQLIDESVADFYRAQDEKAALLQEKSQKDFDDQQKTAERFRDEELAGATNNFKAGLKTLEQYNQRKKDIELSYQRTILDSQLRFYEDQLQTLKNSGGDTIAAMTAIAAIKAQMALLEIDTATEIANKEKELTDRKIQGYKDLAAQAKEVYVDVIGAIFDARISQIDQEINKIDELKAAQIAQVQASGDNEERKAARIKLIEARAQSDKEALERRQRSIERQKAVFERAFKTFQITTDTIQAVGKIKLEVAKATAEAAVNPLKIPAIALTAAQIPIALTSGALSLVSLLAAPLPKFWTGTDNAPEGYAHLAERGRELRIDPDGRMKMYEQHTIDYLQKGSVILNNNATERIVRSGVLQGKQDGGRGQGQEVILNAEAVSELKKLNKKNTAVYINNALNIESTAHYYNNLKW